MLIFGSPRTWAERSVIVERLASTDGIDLNTAPRLVPLLGTTETLVGDVTWSLVGIGTLRDGWMDNSR